MLLSIEDDAMAPKVLNLGRVGVGLLALHSTSPVSSSAYTGDLVEPRALPQESPDTPDEHSTRADGRVTALERVHIRFPQNAIVWPQGRDAVSQVATCSVTSALTITIC